jgi:uncharacterized protein (TIGR02284 family)
MKSASAKVIEDLIETLEDGRKGFEKAAERLEKDGRADIADRMRAFSQERARFSQELRDLAAREGVEIQEDGSMAGALHRGWITLADALTGDDPSAVLSAAESGEDHAVAEFEKALTSSELDAAVSSVVARQAAEVKAAHDEVRTFRDRFAA